MSEGSALVSQGLRSTTFLPTSVPINADDLPAHLRAQLGLKSRKKPSRTIGPGSHPYRCAGADGCGEDFPDLKSADKHATVEHGDCSVRLDAVVQAPASDVR